MMKTQHFWHKLMYHYQIFTRSIKTKICWCLIQLFYRACKCLTHFNKHLWNNKFWITFKLCKWPFCNGKVYIILHLLQHHKCDAICFMLESWTLCIAFVTIVLNTLWRQWWSNFEKNHGHKKKLNCKTKHIMT